MKQKMKHLLSFAAMLVMMVSMFSVCVFPAAAASTDAYTSLLQEAYVVNSAWAGYPDLTPVTFDFRGKSIPGTIGAGCYGSFEEAWAAAKEENKASPVILLCAGDYCDEIVLDSGATILGPNAGVDPNVKSSNKNTAWTLSAKRYDEAYIRNNIRISKNVASGDVVIDGVRFDTALNTVGVSNSSIGGAIVDYQRNSGASELTVKNTVFYYAGNELAANGYSLYLRTSGHVRTLNLENLYIEGENEVTPSGNPARGFISPFFTELRADNIAYINSKNGFLAHTCFAIGAFPVVEITNSCFFNTKSNLANDYVISLDSQTYEYHFMNKQELLIGATDRPGSSLKLHNNIFYNASGKAGVIHYEFTNNRSTVNIQNNYVYADDQGAENGKSIMTAEFVTNAPFLDLTNCMLIKNNVLIGAYKVPSLNGSSIDTRIDMSDNYFATSEGLPVPQPIYVDAENTRLTRKNIWINEGMTTTQEKWSLSIDGWPLTSVDPTNFTAQVLLYDNEDVANIPLSFSSSKGFGVQLYRSAVVTSDGVLLGVSEPIANNKLTNSILNSDPAVPTVIYAQVTDPAYLDFAPIYTITVKNMGSIEAIKDFDDYYEESYPADRYFILSNDVVGVEKNVDVPVLWRGEKYLCTVGANIFATVDEIMEAAENAQIDIPVIIIPEGDYEDEVVLQGSCTILGAQYGVNPNKKPIAIEDLTQANFEMSAWTFNPERTGGETTFKSCIRVSEDADDYIITIDGIKMAPGCSYVDDCSRASHNVTIFKNLYAENAGGGKNSSGTNNASVFNFQKASDTDRCDVYMYDSRLEKFAGRVLFGPCVEKLVFDGVFYGNNGANAQFVNVYQSRGVSDPYFGLTNCYFYNNLSTANYQFIFKDQDVGLAAKTNIVYNICNNVFNNGFYTGNGAFQIYFTGNNMTVYFNNNTLVNNGSNTLFTSNSNSRFVGSCISENVSDMIVCKNNRLIGFNKMPMTHGTGDGTMLDFSGNYFAASLTGAAMDPASAWSCEANSSNTGIYTYEQATRTKIDWTYMDWDLTVRSDAKAPTAKQDYYISKGMYGTGRMTGDTYRDSVPATCTTYENPIFAGMDSTMKLYDASNKEISSMVLSGASTTFYCRVTTGSKTKTIKLVIEREKGNASQLLVIEDTKNTSFYIDEEAATVDAYIDSTKLYEHQSYNFGAATVTLSPGATYGVYTDIACTNKVTSVSQYEKAYIKVVGENGGETIYTVTFHATANVAPEAVANAAIVSVDGMTLVSKNNYEAEISSSATGFTFKPNALYGSTVTVYNGSAKMKANADGSYTLNSITAGTQVLTAVAKNGKKSTSYTLVIKKGKSGESKITSLKYKTAELRTAEKVRTGYLMNLDYASVAEIKATVSTGATYKVYSNAACTKAFANNVVSVLKDGKYQDGIYVYLKVKAENGAESVYPILLRSSANNRTVANIYGIVTNSKGKKTFYKAELAGKNAYVMYLPTGTKSVQVVGGVMQTLNKKGELEKDGSVTNLNGGDVTFYADAAMLIALGSVKLDQKLTNVYCSTATGTASFGEGTENNVRINGANATLQIVSDRNKVTYKDASKFKKNWVKPYVDYLNNNHYGIFKGDENKKLNVDSNITRYEIATIATRVMGLDASKYSESNTNLNFTDKIAKWAKPYVCAAVSSGIMSGHADGDKFIFDGDGTATREQVMKVLVNVWVINAGGKSTLDTSGAVIADAATTYYNSKKRAVDSAFKTYKFKDTKKVSDWAMPYVRLAVAEFKMIGGSLENGKLYLNPKKNITRAEVAKMVAVYYGIND